MEQPLQNNNNPPTNPLDQTKPGIQSFFVGLGVSVLAPTVLFTPLAFLMPYTNDSFFTVMSTFVFLLAYIIIPIILWKKWHFRLGMIILGMFAPLALGILVFGGCMLAFGSLSLLSGTR